jgi:hypothetical protein
VVLDASRWESSDRLPTEQLDWLAADLSKAADAKHTFVFYHRPYWDGTTSQGKPDTLHKLFLRYGVDAVFAGHAHWYSSGAYDGIRYTTVGSSGAAAEPGPTGIRYHHLLVDTDTGGITVTPVLLGGERREWDDVTDEELRLFVASRPPVLKLPEPVVVGPDLTVRDTTTVVVTNTSLTDSLEGTLTWDTPAGWTIVPREVAVGVQPNARVEKAFAVKNSGRLSPVPTVALVLADAPEGTAPVRRSLHVVRVAEVMPTAIPPVIDGSVADQCWRNPVTELLDADGGPAKTDSTHFYFTYDSANLYLAAVCFDPAVAMVKAQASGRDGAADEDDCVGYLFRPDTGRADVFQVFFNATGAVLDRAMAVNGDSVVCPGLTWDGDYTVNTLRGIGFWSIEVKVALPVELIRARPGGVWGVDFRRKQPGRNAKGDWQPTGYDPRALGLLLFR